MSRTTTHADRFTPEGHLTELAANELLLEGETPELEAHLQGCDRCQRYLERLRQADAEFWRQHPPSFAALERKLATKPARRTPGERPHGQPWLRARTAAMVALTTVSAAAALLWLWGPAADALKATQPEELVRLKSSGHRFEVYIHDGQRVRVAQGGDEVHPGDRVGFKIVPNPTGHVMIVGVDQTGSPYLGYPQDLSGASKEFELGPGSVELDQALELDHVLGQERFILLICPTAFSFDQLSEAIHNHPGEQPLLEGCAQRELSLQKVKP